MERKESRKESRKEKDPSTLSGIFFDDKIQNLTRLAAAMLPILVISNMAQFENEVVWWIAGVIMIWTLVTFIFRCVQIMRRKVDIVERSKYTDMVSNLLSLPYVLLLIALLQAPEYQMSGILIALAIGVFCIIPNLMGQRG